MNGSYKIGGTHLFIENREFIKLWPRPRSHINIPLANLN